MPLESRSPKSNRLITKRPTQAIGGVKVAKIGLVSPQRPTSVRSRSNISTRSDQARSGYNTARTVTKFNAYEGTAIQPKSPGRVPKKVRPEPELLEPLKAHNLHLAVENAFLHNSSTSS
jgi:hypothetical protein